MEADPLHDRPARTSDTGAGTPVLNAADPTAALEDAGGEVPSAAAIGPISRGERLEVIDILRGLALFGILAANMRGFGGPAAAYFQPERMWPSLSDRLAQAFIDTFVQGKFITIFAVLFGVGFAVQLSRASARGARFMRVYSRRLLVLTLFGAAHGLLIWFGDILLPYALTGWLLLFFRNRSDRTLAIWAVLGYLWPFALMSGAVLFHALTGRTIPGPPEPTPASLQEVVQIYRDGGWVALTQQRMQEAVHHNWNFGVFLVPNLLALFLLGMLAWRRGFFEPRDESLSRYRRVVRDGLVLGVIGNATAVMIRWFLPMNPFAPTPMLLLVFGIQQVAVPALSLAYVAAVVLLTHDPAWRSRLRPFGAVGRTALSNYLLQSVIGTLLFYSYGLRLFGSVGPALLLVPTVIIYALQPGLSRWWLERYHFGPVEWVWRSATYARFQPMRRRTG